MTHTFLPGDVAMVRRGHSDWHRAMWVDDEGWRCIHGPCSPYVSEVRPLVVIDPEDDGAEAERLWLALRDGRALQSRSHLQAALREFANPTPPKPEEPTGLGAVVEDAEGQRWVRCDPDHLPWHCVSTDRAQHYAYIAAVRVLSEGVQS